ncbi:MAG: LLM class F420-dependent oxidoreductase [Dehalococcoidia bacterium]
MAAVQRWAFTFPLDGVPLRDHRVPFAEAERDGYTDAWTMEVDGLDCLTPIAAAAAWTERLRLGTAIANVYTRTPAVLAMSAASLAELAPGRFVLGVGSSSPVIVQDWSGLPFKEPLQRVRDTTKVLRAALAGERVTADTGRLRLSGFRLSRPVAQPVPLYLAGLREGMLRLAGRLGDGVIINWLAPGDVPRVVQIAKDAAAAAGRDRDTFETVCRIFVCVTDDIEAGRMQGRRAIAAYLTTPVYEAFHIWLGRGAALRPMTEAWRAGDRRGALAAISDTVVDDLFVIGPPERCRERILEYCAAGVDTPVLNFFPPHGPGERAGEESLYALRALAPASAGPPARGGGR